MKTYLLGLVASVASAGFHGHIDIDEYPEDFIMKPRLTESLMDIPTNFTW
jgi:hypothetical protein